MANLGRVAYVNRGAYTENALYEKYDVVLYNHSSYAYINNTASQNNLPTNETYWTLMLEAIPGPAGADGVNGAVGDSGVYIGVDAPTDPEKLVWVDTDGTPTKLYFKDKVVETTDWVADTTYAEFPFKADIPCTGVTSAMYASLAFAYAQATSGDFAPVCDTGTDKVTIYAAAIPVSSFTIPVIEVLAI